MSLMLRRCPGTAAAMKEGDQADEGERGTPRLRNEAEHGSARQSLQHNIVPGGTGNGAFEFLCFLGSRSCKENEVSRTTIAETESVAYVDGDTGERGIGNRTTR